MSLFEVLCKETHENRARLEAIPSVRSLLMGDVVQEQYIRFLKDLYPIVSNFCPLLAAAASRCADKDDDFRNYLYGHIEEEKNHEKIVLSDLSSFNVPADDVLGTFPSPAVQSMLAFNFHVCDRGHAFGIIGMIYVLEVISSEYGARVAKSVSSALQREVSQGFQFLDSHASMDQDHMLKLKELTRVVDLPEYRDYVLNSVRMNFFLLAQVLVAQSKQ